MSFAETIRSPIKLDRRATEIGEAVGLSGQATWLQPAIGPRSPRLRTARALTKAATGGRSDGVSRGM